MNSIIPATKGMVAIEGSDRGQMEMALKMQRSGYSIHLFQSAGAAKLNFSTTGDWRSFLISEPRFSGTLQIRYIGECLGRGYHKMMEITPKMIGPFKQCTSNKFQNLPSFDFDKKERAYKIRIETGIHVLINKCPGKKGQL